MAENNPIEPDLSPRDWPTQRTAELEALRPQFEPIALVVVPTEPGKYRDHTGDPWTLAESGQWFDKHGTTRPQSDNWILVASAPFSKVV